MSSITTIYPVFTHDVCQDRITELEKQLAATAASEARLRDRLQKIQNACACEGMPHRRDCLLVGQMVDEVLSLPPSDAAAKVQWLVEAARAWVVLGDSLSMASPQFNSLRDAIAAYEGGE